MVFINAIQTIFALTTSAHAMNYNDVIRDFASRTISNFRSIQIAKSQGSSSAYEVTALISSFLGLAVFPREKIFSEIPKTPITTLQNEGWPSINSAESLRKSSDLRDFLEKIRHAIAHGNLAVEADNSNEISKITFWNTPPGERKRTWEISLSIPEVEIIAINFAQMIETVCSSKKSI